MKNTTLHQINALWLHVGDGDKELLLSYRNIRAIIPAPVIQRVVPLQSLAAGLIAYRNEIYTAFFLSKLIGNPSGKTDSAGWGLLLEAPGVRLVLLTADFFGLINLKSDKSSFTKHDGNSPPAFMGYAQMAGRNLLLLDPLKLHTLTALRDQGEKQRWYDATNIRPVTVVKRRKSRGVRLVLLADGGHVFALPLKSLFNVRRVMSGNTSTPRLCERLGKSVDSQTRFSSKNPNNTPLVNTDETADWRSGFTCTIRGIQTEVDVRFEALLESIEVMDRQISTWAGMSFLTLKGAFMHTSNKTVFVVDTERLATGGRTVAFAPPATVKQVSESGKVMAHTDTLYKTIRMVILYAGKVQAALPLSAIRFVSTVRSAHIHQVQMDNNLIIGILERSGVFSSVLDLGVLLESDPIPLTPGARLISVESDSGKVVLLATEFGEPEEIQEDKIHPWNIETDPKSKFRPDKAFTLNDGRKVPILDASKVISAAQGQRHE